MRQYVAMRNDYSDYLNTEPSDLKLLISAL
jgi:hypothetical protein